MRRILLAVLVLLLSLGSGTGPGAEPYAPDTLRPAPGEPPLPFLRVASGPALPPAIRPDLDRNPGCGAHAPPAPPRPLRRPASTLPARGADGQGPFVPLHCERLPYYPNAPPV